MLELFSQISQFITPEWQSLFLMLNQVFLPVLLATFLAGSFFRWMIFLAIRGQAKFANAFEQEVQSLSKRTPSLVNPFSVSTKEMLDTTFKKIFGKQTAVTKLLLLREGALRLIKDTVSQIEASQGEELAFYELSRDIFRKNALFNRVMGVAPIGPLSAILNAIPGILIGLGVVGALVGISTALPNLINGTESLAAAERGVGQFISTLSNAMWLSASAGVLSLLMTVMNLFLAPEKKYIRLVDRFADTLQELYRISASPGPSRMEALEDAPKGELPSPAFSAEAVTDSDLAPEKTLWPSMPSTSEENEEKTLITNAEELTLDPEEMRKLELFDHPEAAIKPDWESQLAPQFPPLSEEKSQNPNASQEDDAPGKAKPKAPKPKKAA